MLAPVRVLVTGGEHLGPLAAVRALRRAGHEPWAIVPHRGAYAARSRAVAGFDVAPDAGLEPAAFLERVRDVCARAGVDAVIAGTEPALVVLSRSPGAVSPALLGVPAAPVVERATSKAALPELARAAGLELPPTRVVAREDAPAAAAELGYPVIVKPLRSDVDRGGVLSHGVPVRAAGAAALAAGLAALPGDAVVVQPWLDGRLAAVCGVAFEGELVCASHQVARRIWPPRVGISAYAETVPPDRALEQGVSRLVGELGWSGIFQVQFLLARGTAFVIDLNPRLYGSLALAIAAGLDLPTIWVELLAGRRPRVAEYAVGVGYRSEEREAQAIAHALRHGPRLQGLAALAPRRRTTHAVLRADDPRPALASLAKLVSRGGGAPERG
jgi:predicted ATP-grasp superfamily ATP-dependent carboligase